MWTHGSTQVDGSWKSLWWFSSSHPTPVLQMRVGMARASGARRMLANGRGSSSGMNLSTSSSRQPLPDAEEFEGLLLELGKPGHCSAGSLANRRGGLPASGGLLGLFLALARRLGGGAALPCRGVVPLRPSCGCLSPGIPGGHLTRRRHGAVDPLPHLPAMVGRLHSSVLCLVAAGDGFGLLSHQAGWSCSQDGSPLLPLEAGG